MGKILALFFLLLFSQLVSAKLYRCTGDDGLTVFSDTPCASDAEEVKGIFVPDTGNVADDEAIMNCIDFLNSTGSINDQEGIKVHSHRYEWVTVKDIGARRVLHLLVNVRNQNGAYDGPRPMQCLMMGDGISVNINSFELVD